MIFYSVYHGETNFYFSTKREAMNCAKTAKHNIKKQFMEGLRGNTWYPIVVERLDIGEITKNKILRILKQNAWVTERIEIWRSN